MRTFTIAGRVVDDDSDAFVVAEIGSNHQGSMQTCMELFRQAKVAGADAVKLQKRDLSTWPPEQYARPYDSEHAFGPTYGLHREALEFHSDEYRELQDYAESLGLIFFATAFDLRSVDFLDDLNMPAIKIASFDVRSIPLIRYAASTGRPLIVSTGTATLDDVDLAHTVSVSGNSWGALLHATTEYPAPAERLNLRCITTMRDYFPSTVIGYSSHFNGISMPLVAYVLGARIIEVHFTLNRAMKGSDHAFSLEPDGLRKLVRDLKRAKVALGDGVKRAYAEEMPALAKQGKPTFVVA